ncbi:SDR family NAD(P)-dependent oxidoreductase [Vibrio fluvialis]|uniref:SDR family NAD(P)-dependent oxidoreductase n=1 Tax=Vibrio fluvialis TaxID=676 RepID=UPI0028E09310|nr:SDR family oxidoreductase [Vibrio fluvialis]MDT8865930.1 SDR family oxidoreductase [Vibrio fluvialis]MDT8873698.1 SDR family oxidoreductase [Vibrio fluvialis]
MKAALVTGGSKGIGLEMVLRLLALGYQVITCSRNPTIWQQAVAHYSQLESVDYHTLDIADEQAVIRFFGAIDARYGKLDVAVNNASPALASRGAYETVADYLLKETLNQDFWAQALCLKYELGLMFSGASIVNISSVNGLRPTPNAAMYSAAKHALEGLTRSLALENIAQGIRINAVAPGVTWTPRWDERQLEVPSIRDDVSAVVPMERFARPDEIVDAVEFLISAKASYIVGHTLVVDGGLSLA